MKKICKYSSVKNAVAFVNATSVPQIALKYFGTNNKTEILVPTVTFVAPVNAIIYNSGSPIFMDVDKYFTIDLNKTLEFLDKKQNLKMDILLIKTGKKMSYNRSSCMGNAVFLDDIKKYVKKKYQNNKMLRKFRHQV